MLYKYPQNIQIWNQYLEFSLSISKIIEKFSLNAFKKPKSEIINWWITLWMRFYRSMWFSLMHLPKNNVEKNIFRWDSKINATTTNIYRHKTFHFSVLLIFSSDSKFYDFHFIFSSSLFSMIFIKWRVKNLNSWKTSQCRFSRI